MRLGTDRQPARWWTVTAIVAAFCLFVLVAAGDAHAAPPLTCSGSTSTASDGITDDSTTIQNAINAASAGGVVEINAGTCKISRPITISKALTLRGATAGVAPGASGWASGQTKLEGFYNAQWGVSNFTVVIQASDVTVSGFEFGDTGYNLIDLEGTISDVEISYNHIHSTQLWGGIILGNTGGTFTDVTIDHNLIEATGTKDGSNASGLVRYGSKAAPNLTVTNNTFRQAPIGGFVLFGWAVFDGLTFADNTILSGLVNIGTANDAVIKDNVFGGPNPDSTTQGHGLFLNGVGTSGLQVRGNDFLPGGRLEFGNTARNAGVRNNAFFANTSVVLQPATAPNPGADPSTIAFATNGFPALTGPTSCALDSRTNVLIDGPGFGMLRASGNWWDSSGGPTGGFCDFDTDRVLNWITSFVADPEKSSAPGFWPTDIVSNAVATTTPTGTNVALPFVSPDGAPVGTISFANVTSPGETAVASFTTAFPVEPSGFSLGDPPTYYEISTTATFDGSIEVCLVYPVGSFPAGTVPRLLHHDGTAWVDVTTSLDQTTRTICGSVTSLSPFAVGSVPAPAADTPITTKVQQPRVRITAARAIGSYGIRVDVRVSRAGTVRVTGTRRSARGVVRACTARRTVTRAGTYALICKLTPSTRAALRTADLRVTVRASLRTGSAEATSAARVATVARRVPVVPAVTG